MKNTAADVFPATPTPRASKALVIVPLLSALLLAACGGGDPVTASAAAEAQREVAMDANGDDGAGESCTDLSGGSMYSQRFAALTAALATALSACGGGGGDGGGSGNGVEPPPAGSTATTEVVVQLNTGVSATTLASDYQLTVVDQFGKRPIWRLRLASGTSIDTKLAQLRADTARVRFAEANIEGETPEGRKRSAWAVGGDAAAYATQWAPDALRLPEAHARSVGAGMRVAVLDTGIDLTHPAFVNRLARNGSGTLLGRDFVDDDADPSEVGSTVDLGFGHGTHVAGLVSLVAPAATLMPARVLDRQGRGNIWVLAEALAWAVDPDGNPATDDGAHVINLSLGTTQPTNLLRTAVALADCDFDDDDEEFDDPGFDDDKARCANKYGAVVLAAAGNDGSATLQQFPAAEAVPGSLSLAASTQARTLAGFSNSGSWVELAAPGDRIISAVPGGGYGTWSGTSMAAPLAAGTAALVLATYADPRSVLPLDVANRLTARSSQLCGTSLRNVDAAAAVFDTTALDPACN